LIGDLGKLVSVGQGAGRMRKSFYVSPQRTPDPDYSIDHHPGHRLFKNIPGNYIHVPPQNLVRLQGFRFFVEPIVGVVHAKSTARSNDFEGRNFDVLTGLSAPVVAYLISSKNSLPPSFLLERTVAGLLANIV